MTTPVLSQEYAITITLQPKLFKQSIEKQYDMLENEIRQKIETDNIYLTLVVELTKSYNIHAHGFIKVINKNAVRFIYDSFRNNPVIGYIYVKPVDDHGKWLDYITKNLKMTKDTLNCRIPIICDELDLIGDDALFAVYRNQ